MYARMPRHVVVLDLAVRSQSAKRGGVVIVVALRRRPLVVRGRVGGPCSSSSTSECTRNQQHACPADEQHPSSFVQKSNKSILVSLQPPLLDLLGNAIRFVLRHRTGSHWSLGLRFRLPAAPSCGHFSFSRSTIRLFVYDVHGIQPKASSLL